MTAQEKEAENSGKIRSLKELSFLHKTLEERAEAYGGKMNLDAEYDWGASVGREIW